MEGPGDDLPLLLPAELVEIHRVARHPDGEAGVLLRVVVGIQQGLPVVQKKSSIIQQEIELS